MSNTIPSAEQARTESAIATALREKVDADKIELPVLPEVASQVITASMDSECDLRQLTAVIERDPPMTAHMLRLANSALYSTTVEITCGGQPMIHWQPLDDAKKQVRSMIS